MVKLLVKLLSVLSDTGTKVAVSTRTFQEPLPCFVWDIVNLFRLFLSSSLPYSQLRYLDVHPVYVVDYQVSQDT